MAAASAGIGVVSTIANISAQNKQAKAASQAAQVQKYAQEVQYETSRQNLAQQKEYAKQQQDLTGMQLQAQDNQARMALAEQSIQGTMSNAQATFANAQQLQNAQTQFNEAQSQANRQEYQVNEQARTQQSQGLEQSTQTNSSVSTQMQQLQQALSTGDRQRAAVIASQAAQGQDDSVTGGLLSSDTEDLVVALRQKVEAGRFTEQDMQQLMYNSELSSLLQDIGLSEVDSSRQTNENALKYANTVGDLNKANLGFTEQQNALGNKMGQQALTGATAIRDQSRNIDSKFNELGFQAQNNSLSASSAAQIASSQAQSNASRPNGFLSALQIGGSLFNAAAPYVMPKWTPPGQQPVRGQERPTMRWDGIDVTGNTYG